MVVDQMLPLNQVLCGDCVEVLKDFPENSVKKICPICGQIFFVEKSRIKHGRGITCSKECQNKWVSLKLKRGDILKCPVCSREFYCSLSRMKDAKYTPVCSKECLYKGRSLGIIQREVKNRYHSSPRTKFTKECPICEKSFETVPSRIDDGRGKYCSRKCFEKAHRKNMAGDKCHFWVDGRSYDKQSYRGSDWEEIRKIVYERDNYTCQICGVKCISRRDLSDENSHKLIQCHHLKEYDSEEDNDLDNLITACVSCHGTMRR